MVLETDVLDFALGAARRIVVAVDASRASGPLPDLTIGQGESVYLRWLSLERRDDAGQWSCAGLPPAREGDRYVFSPLAPGTYRFVSAPVAGCAPLVTSPIVVAPDADPAPVTLVLAPGRTLKGRVLDENEKPLALAQVRLDVASASISAETDADGSFELANVPPGVWKCTFSAGTDRTATIDVDASSAVIPDVKLERREGATPPSPRAMKAHRGIDIAVEECELEDVLDLISRQAGKKIVVASDAKGKITVELRNVPWEAAVRQIAAAAGCEVEERDGGLYVKKR